MTDTLVPVWTELLADVSTPVGVFPALAADGPGVILESVERSERWGRYSVVAGEPAALVEVDEGGVRVTDQRRDLPLDLAELRGSPLEQLKALARQLHEPRHPDLPPLTGGLVGYLSYEAAALLEPGPPPSRHVATGPAMRFAVVDRAVVFDHWRQRLIVVVHVPSRHGDDRGAAALSELVERVRNATPPPVEPLEPPAAVPVDPRPNIADDEYRQAVLTTKEHILAGEIFQGVMSRRMSVPAPEGALAIYRRLRVTNPAPYMFFLRLPDMELAGSSPEPLVRVEGRRVTTRPIAGTLPRGRDAEEDAAFERQLLADPKERAEHAMLVDLARNDIGRVSKPGTVVPTELMQVERFSRVMHLVSTVEGELRDGLTALDALGATFPAGTVTGAPKRRAMEIIGDLEPDPRGPYAGAAGYLTFAGDLDFCITIRTVVVQDGVAHVQAGAGIVADSDPDRELQETRAKASAILAAVAGRP